jgi:hypothetical protein
MSQCVSDQSTKFITYQTCSKDQGQGHIRKKSPHYIDIYRQIDILDSLDKSPVSSPVPCLLRATEPGPCLVRATERNRGAMGAYRVSSEG